jgi:GT2 family glycosyltransferase/tetratricopeptide (TPR) repeat protein
MSIGRVAIIFDDQVRADTTGAYCRRALEKMINVTHFRPHELSKVPVSGFDLYLNIDDGLEYYLPANLRPCAWWAIDTHLNLEWCLKRAQGFDFVFAAQRDGAEQMQQTGIASACWLPLACEPDMHRKHEAPKQYDACFVGHVFPGPRAELIALIERHFRSTFVGQRFFEDMARTYSASRTVLNRSIRNDVNMRVFEALACGSLLVTNDLSENGQAELFQDGVHLATYGDGEELVDKIRFYLERETLRERIAAAGRAQVLAQDTYLHRMEKLLAAVERGVGKRSVAATSTGVKHAETTAAAVPLPGESWSLDRVEEGLLTAVQKSPSRVLVVGPGGENIATALKKRHAKELPETHGGADSQLIAEAFVGERIKRGPFDLVVLPAALAYVVSPVDFLRELGRRLAPGGQILAAVANVRHHSRIRALLEGHWDDQLGGREEETYGRAFRRGRRPAPSARTRRSTPGAARFFTRREIEKLFFRAGMGIRELHGIPGAGHEAWQRNGRAGEVKIGGLQIGGIPPDQAEQFYLAGYLVRAEPEAIPDYGLTSIIVVTHNQLAYTKQCLDSIRRFTDEPYELLLVDNGSTDGTVPYFQSHADATVILNSENKGFPAAVNQGMKASKGAQVVLLNNDCIVTTGWLTRLLRALQSDPKIGLVGPCSNFVSREQQIPVAYDEDLVGLDGFAWEWGKANDAVRQDTDRLVGFCLMIRRELIDDIGLLDEQFGIGCFEDDDYCRRAIGAGYRAVIARDAFVHHFGGRTFVGAGVDFSALMAKNQLLFEAKWSTTEPPAPSERQTGRRVRRRAFDVRVAKGGGLLLVPKEIQVSLCMIARDNARTIGASLESVRPWVDEMIVVDTGSKDETAEIAGNLGARVHHFTWCDDFSAARNESIKHARGKWIFWMDSDDTIDATNGRKLRELAERKSGDSLLGYVMQVHCPGAGADGTDVTVVDHLKLFRNLPELRFDGRIHEQILPAVRRANGSVAFTDIYVTHSGYDHSPEGQKRKLERDLRLLHLEFKERPDHPFTLFNLGMTYTDVGRYEEAAYYLWRSIEHSGPGESHVRKAYSLLVHCEAQAGGPESACEICQKGLRLFPQDAELRFRKGVLLHQLGRLAEAVEAYQDLLGSDEDRHFTSVDRAIRGFKARQNLAIVYEEMGELEKAEEEWRKVVEEMRYYRPGWRGLGSVLLRQGEEAKALAIADELVRDPPLRTEGRMLRGRALALGRDVESARREFETAAREDANGVDSLEALCRFLFEFVDPGEAQGPLEELVRRDPQNGASYHNLGTAYLRNGRPRDAVAAYRKSIECRPEAAPTYISLGHALSANGDLQQAIEAWQQALRLAPENVEAKSAIEHAQATATVGSGR